MMNNDETRFEIQTCSVNLSVRFEIQTCSVSLSVSWRSCNHNVLTLITMNDISITDGSVERTGVLNLLFNIIISLSLGSTDC